MDHQSLEALLAEAEQTVRQLEQAAGVREKIKAAERTLDAWQKDYDEVKDKLEKTQAEIESLRGLRALFGGRRKAELEKKLAGWQDALKTKERWVNDSKARCDQARAEMPDVSDLPDEQEAIYRLAGLYVQAERCADAARAYSRIHGYKDVDSILKNDGRLYAELYRPGNTVLFGHYRQSGDAPKGKEAIEWLVLRNAGGKVTMISKHALDYRPYFDPRATATWMSCPLRFWLNDEFLKAAFTGEEQAKLAEVEVTADNNRKYMTNPGRSILDRVYLLSIIEADSYFDSLQARSCAPTPYAVSQGARSAVGGTAEKCDWWLRTPGKDGTYAAYVHGDGSIDMYGSLVNTKLAVRPVITLKI